MSLEYFILVSVNSFLFMFSRANKFSLWGWGGDQEWSTSPVGQLHILFSEGSRGGCTVNLLPQEKQLLILSVTESKGLMLCLLACTWN